MPLRIWAIFLLCALSTASPAQSPDGRTLSWSGQIGIASGLVYRGIDLGDQLVIPNFDLAVEHDSGFYLHGWLTRASLPRPAYYGESRESMWQTLVDAGYHWRPAERWTLSLDRNWYLYSDNLPGHSPDYGEWALGLDYNTLFALHYAHSEDLWGRDTRQDVLSLSALWPFTRHLIGAATFGRVEQGGYYEDGYHFLRFNLGFLLRDWSAQLQFHDTFGVGDSYGAGRTGRAWVAQLNWLW